MDSEYGRLRDGEVPLTSAELRNIKCGVGNRFWNIAANGESPQWVIRPEQPAETHEITHIFGYEVRGFMARQYRGDK